MDREQREHIRKVVKPGVALVSDPRYSEPFLINVPFLRIAQDVSDDEVLERLDAKTEQLYHPADAPTVKDAIRRERGIPADAAGLLQEPQRYRRSQTKPKSKENRKATIDSPKTGEPIEVEDSNYNLSLNDEQNKAADSKGNINILDRLIIFWLNQTFYFIPQSELFKRFGITSGSIQNKITHLALTHGYIIRHPIQKAKSTSMYWEPTDKAWQLAGIPKPQQRGKGGYVHQSLAALIANNAKKKGYQIEIESFQQNNKAIDLVLRKDAELVFIEIAVSEPMEKEITNIVKNLDSGTVPTKFYIACLTSQSRIKMADIIHTQLENSSLKDNIEVVLALDLPKLI